MRDWTNVISWVSAMAFCLIVAVALWVFIRVSDAADAPGVNVRTFGDAGGEHLRYDPTEEPGNIVQWYHDNGEVSWSAGLAEGHNQLETNQQARLDWMEGQFGAVHALITAQALIIADHEQRLLDCGCE